MKVGDLLRCTYHVKVDVKLYTTTPLYRCEKSPFNPVNLRDLQPIERKISNGEVGWIWEKNVEVVS